MADFEKKFFRFVGAGPDRVSSGFVLGAANKSGKEYVQAFGNEKLEESSRKLSKDSVFWIASCTKLVTTIAALQCVEKGQFTLDEDVTRLLPEWKSPQILTGFGDDGQPQYTNATKAITLRQLLTHSSGMTYDYMSPLHMQLRANQGQKALWVCGDIKRGYFDALLSEPGTSWHYSPGIDWAGQMVERANGGIKLGEYFQKNIFDPLGVKDATFNINTRPDLKERLVPYTERGDGGLVNPTTDTEFTFPLDPKDHCGGAGLRTTVPEYMKILKAVLARDEKILRADSFDLMYKSNLSDGSMEAYNGVLTFPDFHKGCVPGTPQGIHWTWGLGGTIHDQEDIPGQRRKGSMSWQGLPNLTWWVDESAETCGLVATQLVPPGDALMHPVVSEFQKYVFEELGKN